MTFYALSLSRWALDDFGARISQHLPGDWPVTVSDRDMGEQITAGVRYPNGKRWALLVGTSSEVAAAPDDLAKAVAQRFIEHLDRFPRG